METIITHPNFSYLGEQITQNNENFKQAKVKIDKFPDGWPNIFFEDVDGDIERKNITYIGDYSSANEIFLNYSIVRATLGYFANKVRVIIPFFPVGTMERISKKGEVATSKYMADILSYIPPCRHDKPSIHIFDIHTLEQRFFFDDFKVNPELHTAMYLIKEKLRENSLIVFPDEGAKKRFEGSFSLYDTIYCSKKRNGNKREITIESESSLKGRNAFIIDDLIQSGGTIRETSKKLRELGANTVNAFATHGVFPLDSHIKLAQELDTLYTTDTIPTNLERIKDVPNMQVLSIQPLIEKILNL